MSKKIIMYRWAFVGADYVCAAGRLRPGRSGWQWIPADGGEWRGPWRDLAVAIAAVEGGETK
jgi:hypothetical protein